MASIQLHVAAIHELMRAADQSGILLWLGNGWAVDAMLGRATREHEDIDVVYDEADLERVIELLESLGYAVREWTDYGFILDRDGVELDMDKCVQADGGYTFEEYPAGCCPLDRRGIVEDMPVRCTTWDALFLEMLYNQRAIRAEQWREKDVESFKIIADQIAEARQAELRVYDIETWGQP